jgi:hypothetical protein
LITVDVNEIRLDERRSYEPTYRESGLKRIKAPPSDVRFDLAADLDAGTVSVRVRSVDVSTKQPFDWYSIGVPPSDLYIATPIVFWLCHNVVVRLIPTADGRRLF